MHPLSLFSTSITNIIHYTSLPSHSWQFKIDINFQKMKSKIFFIKMEPMIFAYDLSLLTCLEVTLLFACVVEVAGT